MASRIAESLVAAEWAKLGEHGLNKGARIEALQGQLPRLYDEAFLLRSCADDIDANSTVSAVQRRHNAAAAEEAARKSAMTSGPVYNAILKKSETIQLEERLTKERGELLAARERLAAAKAAFNDPVDPRNRNAVTANVEKAQAEVGRLLAKVNGYDSELRKLQGGR